IENLINTWLAAAQAQLRVTGALGRLEEGLRKAKEMGDRLGEGEILVHRAVILASQEKPDWEAAWRDLEESAEILERVEARPYLARTLIEHARLLRWAGRFEESEEQSRRAAELYREMGISPPNDG
ncbi:MAG: hypothetical protein M3252_02290, partial [Actinomycetota bacterium]|nr:hypothetical protein [Actinomycetota bacterium]